MATDMRNGLLFGAALGGIAAYNGGSDDMGASVASIAFGILLGYGVVRFMRWRRRS